MPGSLYLAWHYLRRNLVITGVLTAALTLIILLPAVLILVLDDASDHLVERAESTPLVLGAKGSQLELILGTLYFADPAPQALRISEVERLRGLDRGRVIPLHSGHRIRGAALVATTGDYFDLRHLSLDRGGLIRIPGECILGAAVARRLGLDVGATLLASPGRAFDLGEAPLQLRVTGVLRDAGTPDDDAIFTNLRTVWIIEGLGHGHLEGSQHGSPSAKPYRIITPENLRHFHFHGREDEFPITAAIVEPKDDRARALLLGEFLSPDETVQLVRPDEVMNSLLATVVAVRGYVVALLGAVSVVTLFVVALVIALSVRLRRGEILTMGKIGCARHTVVAILACQVAIVLFASVVLAAALTGAAFYFGDELMRWLLLR